MTLFQRIETIEPALAQATADIAALKIAPAGGVTVDQLAAVQAQVDGLRVDVGTPVAPPAA